MNEERLLTVLAAPHISEKASQTAGALPQYVFKVAKDATKPEIKAAVEQLFKVSVRSVQSVNQKGKQTRFGRVMGRRKDWKKAYVVLEQGQTIDFAS